METARAILSRREGVGSRAQVERLAFERSKGSGPIETGGDAEGRQPDSGRYVDLVVRRCGVFSLCDCGQVTYLAEICWRNSTILL